MTKDASVKPKMPTTMHFFNFDKWLGNPNLYMGGGEAGGDELDRAQARDIKSKEAKLRSLEVDAYMTGKQAEIEKAKREIAAATGATPGTAIVPSAMHLDAPMLEALAKMPDDQREKVTTSAMNLAMMQAGQGGGQNTMSFMWPILMNMVKQNPTVPQIDVMQFAMKMNEMLVAGFSLGKSSNTPQSGGVNDMVRMFEVFGNFYKTSIEDRLGRIVQDLKPGPSFFEELMTNEKYAGFASKIFGGAQTSVEVAQIQATHSLEMARLDEMKQERIAAHNENIVGSQSRWNIINGMITSLAPAIAKVVEGMGEAAATRVNPREVNVKPTPAQPVQQPQNQQQAQTQAPAQPAPPIGPPSMLGKTANLLPVECDQCHGTYYLNKGQLIVQCPHCGEISGDDAALAKLKEMIANSEAPQTSGPPPDQAQAPRPVQTGGPAPADQSPAGNAPAS